MTFNLNNLKQLFLTECSCKENRWREL